MWARQKGTTNARMKAMKKRTETFLFTTHWKDNIHRKCKAVRKCQKAFEYGVSGHLQARGFGRLLYGQIVQFRKSTKSILTNSTPTEDGQESLSYVEWSYPSICKNICICDTGMQKRWNSARDDTRQYHKPRAKKGRTKCFLGETGQKIRQKCKNICRQSAKKIASLERFSEQL